MSIGILCFPAGWDNDHVRGICGASSDDYVLGDCGIRWAFVLAVVAVLDAWILGCLAFTLSHRHAKPVGVYGGVMHHSESPYMNPGSIYKGEINSGFIGDTQSLAGSRKSLNLLHGQPVVMMPHPSATGGHGPGFPPPPPPFLQGGSPADIPQMSPPPPPDIYSDFSHRQHANNHQRHAQNESGANRNENVPSPYRNQQQQHNTSSNPYGPSIQNFQL